MQITAGRAKKNLERIVIADRDVVLDNEEFIIANKKSLYKCERAT